MESSTTILRRLLDERGAEWQANDTDVLLNTVWKNEEGQLCSYFEAIGEGSESWHKEFSLYDCTPEQAIAATLGDKKAKAHPYGYEPDTGAFDATRCECGCLNDISATYCNDCGGVIEVDMNAEKEIYHIPRHLVFAEKHDDGSLEFGGKRYVAATLGNGKLTAEQVREAIERYSTELLGGSRLFIERDWQAIADELNATPSDDGYKQAAEYWKGMYEELLTERIGEERDYPIHDGRYECPECGNVVYYDELHGGGWTIYVEDYQIPFNACPNCGKAVRR